MEALSQMSRYSKFPKELLTNKRKLEKVNMVSLNKNCYAILDINILMKLRDPGSFMILCLLDDGIKENAFTDSGASINIMPNTIYMKLELGVLKPTRITL